MAVNDTLKDKLHYIAKLIQNNKNDYTWESSFDRWRQFIDNQLIPTRIEQSTLVANLAAEQADLKNKNETLVKIQSDQLSVIDRVVNDFYNRGYSSLRSFQSTDYKINEKDFQIQFLKYGFILSALSSILIGLSMLNYIPKSISSAIISVLFILYFIILIMKVRHNRLRLKYEWNKVYYKGPKTDTKKCPDNNLYNLI